MIERVVYAGSFDLLTNGHSYMIEQGAKLGKQLIVAVGVNPEKDKRAYMPIAERLTIIEEVVADLGLKNVAVDSFPFKYLIRYAQEMKADAILRGIRNPSDFQNEIEMRHFNADQDPSIQTIFLTPPRALIGTSSSMVKGLIGPEGWKPIVKTYVPRPVFNYVLTKSIHDRFVTEWRQAGGIGDTEEIFLKLAKLYSASNRHYHTLEHVSACLDELDAIPNKGENFLTAEMRNEIALAIFFHDAIYNPKKNDNEFESAMFFREIAENHNLLASSTLSVYHMILATKDHEASTRAAQYLLDIDLSILGTSDAVFDRYDQDIRKEYAHVSDVEWNFGRKQFMKKFLNRERLFKTDWFHARFEDKAKANLRRLCQ